MTKGKHTYYHVASGLSGPKDRPCKDFERRQYPVRLYPEETEQMHRAGGLWWTDIEKPVQNTLDRWA